MNNQVRVVSPDSTFHGMIGLMHGERFSEITGKYERNVTFGNISLWFKPCELVICEDVKDMSRVKTQRVMIIKPGHKLFGHVVNAVKYENPYTLKYAVVIDEVEEYFCEEEVNHPKDTVRNTPNTSDDIDDDIIDSTKVFSAADMTRAFSDGLDLGLSRTYK